MKEHTPVKPQSNSTLPLGRSLLPVRSPLQPKGSEGIGRSPDVVMGHSFSNLALTPIQAKLTIGEPNNQYEQEADRVAAQVMSTPDSAVQRSVKREAGLEEEVQMKPLAAGIAPLVQPQGLTAAAEPMQMKSAGGAVQSGSQPSLEDRLSRSKGGGSPLSQDVRAFMEPRFGADFGGVRVHTGGDAVQMNRDLSAQAFTHQKNIHFGSGKAPGKDDLTAHELTHVIQQTGMLQRQLIGPSVGTAPPSTRTRTIDGSVGSVSWIDPASPAGSGTLGVPDPAPSAAISEGFITGSSGFRFSNYLHGCVETTDAVTVASSRFYPNSGLYTSPSQFGLPSQRFPIRHNQTSITRGGIQGVQFQQLVGARTISAGVAAATVGTGVGIGAGALLGSKGGAVIGALGGPIGAGVGALIGGVLGAGAGYLAGTATVNNIPQTNFPPIWTEVRLTIMADGTRDFQLLQHSLFPSNTFYINPIGANTLVLSRNYGALASQQTAWQNGGWGSGNPWGMTRPTFTP